MNTDPNGATSAANHTEGFQALAVVLERIELRVDAPLRWEVVRALSESGRDDAARPSWLQVPGLTVDTIASPPYLYRFAVNRWVATLDPWDDGKKLSVVAWLPLGDDAALESLEDEVGQFCRLLFGEEIGIELQRFEIALYGHSTTPLLCYLPSQIRAEHERMPAGRTERGTYCETPWSGRGRLAGVHTRAGRKYVVYLAREDDPNIGAPNGIFCGSEAGGLEVTLLNHHVRQFSDEQIAVLKADGRFDESLPIRVLRLSFTERCTRPPLTELPATVARHDPLGGFRHVAMELVGGAVGHSMPAFFRLVVPRFDRPLSRMPDDPRWRLMRDALLRAMPEPHRNAGHRTGGGRVRSFIGRIRSRQA